MELREMRADLYFPVAEGQRLRRARSCRPTSPSTSCAAARRSTTSTAPIASGIGGTAMPTWKNVLPDRDLWAMAHYVRSLVALRGTPEAAALQRRAARPAALDAAAAAGRRAPTARPTTDVTFGRGGLAPEQPDQAVRAADRR